MHSLWPFRLNPTNELPEKSGGLNRSVQHHLM